MRGKKVENELVLRVKWYALHQGLPKDTQLLIEGGTRADQEAIFVFV